MTEPTTTDDVILVDRDHDGVAEVTLNRPNQLNAMNADLIGGLHATLDGLRSDRSCRVIVLTGAGRAFCAGLDLKEGAAPASVAGLGRAQAGMAVQQSIAGLVPKMRAMPQPIISAVNGAATGGGFALALASDIRIASTAARFNVAFVRIGLSGCDVGVSWLLPRLVGASRAYELLAAAHAEADLILANSPFGIQMTKEVMWSQLEVGSLAAGIDLENRTQILTSTTADMGEAVQAFLEKRPPNFTDR